MPRKSLFSMRRARRIKAKACRPGTGAARFGEGLLDKRRRQLGIRDSEGNITMHTNDFRSLDAPKPANSRESFERVPKKGPAERFIPVTVFKDRRKAK
ncbi:MAG: hypothetical protein PHH08_00110 [Candidatus ainarchaeum sp.]|nr:hypothetical protein [Candidatus ainarchaeum sp.]